MNFISFQQTKKFPWNKHISARDSGPCLANHSVYSTKQFQSSSTYLMRRQENKTGKTKKPPTKKF